MSRSQLVPVCCRTMNRIQLYSKHHRVFSTNYPSQYPPILFDLILQSDWTAASKRVRSHPKEVRYKHPRGYTMLHCAVESGAPLECVKAMVHAFPEGVKMKDWKGRNVADVALYDETKEFLRKYETGSMSTTVSTEDSITRPALLNESKLDIVQQLERTLNAISLLEQSCEQLRKDVDLLIAKLKDN